MLKTSKILAIGAHPDDVETGCGATLAMHHENTSILTFTECGVAEEWEASMKVLNPHRSVLLNFPKRELPKHRPQIRAELERYRDSIQPNVVFTHHPTNPHQDHRCVYEETIRVFKRHTIIGYSVAGWYTPNLYIRISPAAVMHKHQMLRCYQSQRKHESGATRYSMRPEVITANLLFHGMQINVMYAEAFELLRGVIL